MAKYNKVVIASNMFMEAHQRFVDAIDDIDFIVAIILAGSVIGIISPLLKEQGTQTSHQIMAEISNLLVEEDEADFHEGVFREIYNSFKHAGNYRKGVKPSDDLEINADLNSEAAYMLDAARDDFRKIVLLDQVQEKLPKGFLMHLESEYEYV